MKEQESIFTKYKNTISGIAAIVGIVAGLYGIFFQKTVIKLVLSDSKSITSVEENGSSNLWTSIVLYVLFSAIITFSIYKFVKTVRQRKQRTKAKIARFSKNTPYSISTRNIILGEAEQNKIILSPIKFTNNTTIDDVIYLASKVYNTDKSASSIENCIRKARMLAYTEKYSNRTDEDEKIMGVNSLDKNRKLRGHWEEHFIKVLSLVGIKDFGSVDVIDVGIGNANSYTNTDLFSRPQIYWAIDLSKKALDIATAKFPHMKPEVFEAENLKGVPNCYFDLYLSFRTYQSTLFNRREALREARRVLRPGGSIIISIPTLLYHDGIFEDGLCDVSNKPSIEYAEYVTDSIKRRLEVPGFQNIGVYKDSPYEYFLYAQLAD